MVKADSEPRVAQRRLLERLRFQHRLSTAGQLIYYELMVAAKSSDERAPVLADAG